MLMLIPNIDRVIIKPIPVTELKSPTVVLTLSKELGAGENLCYGKIVHAGDTKFAVGQEVFYAEYSAAVILDMQAIIRGEKNLTKAQEDGWVVVAQDDIMAYYDISEVSVPTEKDKS
jgi:hypothetical protein